MASSTKVVVAAGLIVFRRLSNEIQYLMLQASYGDFHWSPPKGHVDPGETEMEAALRETDEEAGLTATQLSLHTDFKSLLHYEVRGKPKMVIFWLGELLDPETKITLSSEHKDFKWLNFKDSSDIAKYDDMKQALGEANSFVIETLKY